MSEIKEDELKQAGGDHERPNDATLLASCAPVAKHIAVAPPLDASKGLLRNPLQSTGKTGDASEAKAFGVSAIAERTQRARGEHAESTRSAALNINIT
jgi:hypothetical protein